jgi:hypothetical protein
MITKEEEQLVTKGDEAETLLQSAAFNTCINSMVESTFNNYVNSEPEAGEKREINYRHYRALVDVVNTLKQWVSVRDEINERLAHDTDDISREDQ